MAPSSKTPADADGVDLAALAPTLFEEAGDAVLIFDPAGEQVVDSNSAARSLTGFTEQELAARVLGDVLHADTPGALPALRAELAAGGRYQSADGFFLRHRDEGVWLPVGVTARRAPAGGRPLALLLARDLRAMHESRRQIESREADLRRVLASVSDCVWSAAIDPANRWTLIYCSPAIETLTGRSVDRFGGDVTVWFEILHPDDRPRIQQEFAAVLAERRGGEAEYRIARPDGSVRWVRNAFQIREGAPGHSRIDGVLTDVTDRRQSEERLRESEKKYRNLVETSNDLIWAVDADARWTFVNRKAALAIYGCEPEEMLGRPFTDFETPEQAARDLAVFARIKAGEPLFRYETVHRRKDGTPVHLAFNAIVLRDAAGRVAGTTGTASDVTARKRAEDALRASEAKYRTLIEHLDQAVFLKDRDLRYAAANRNCCLLLGCQDLDPVGKTDFDLFPRPIAERSRAADRAVLATGTAAEALEEYPVAGRPRVLRVARTPVTDDAGGVVGVLGIGWDVTDQRAQEEQLRQIQKMEAVGQLAGGMAHDFNNVLTVVLGNLSLVRSGQVTGEEAAEHLHTAERAATRAAELSRTLLGFARGAPLHAASVDVPRAIDETVRLVRSTIPPSIDLEVHTAPDVWPARADPGQLNQVLMNLALNARDAMPRGGTIRFRTANFVPDAAYLRGRVEARPGEFVRVRVEDTGVGMPDAVKARIFEPFFTTKGPGQGTGLGLAMVFSIVKQHDGWVACDSEPGRGTAFDLFLPRHRETAPPAAAPPAAAAPAAGGTVLVIDDEPMIRGMVQAVLERAGYRVLVAEDGVAGVEAFRARHGEIDLVVLDGMMPRLSGRDTLRELVRVHPGVRVVFSTGYATEQLAVSEYPQVHGYLPKPYRSEELTRVVADILEQARQAGPESQ